MRNVVLLAVIVTATVACAERQPPAHSAGGGGDELAGVAPGEETVSARRVWSGPEALDVTGSPSPDGRYLAFVDWSTGDLAVRDLVEQESRRLTDKGSWAESYEFAIYPVISWDGDRVAYAWHTGADGDSWELRTIGLDGEDERAVYRNDDVVRSLSTHGWSPDGRLILTVIQGFDRNHRIALVSAEDGSVRTLRSLDWRYPERLSFSPDGRFLAFDLPPDPDARNRDIFVMDLEAGREHRITSEPASNNRFIGWAADGNALFYVSDGAGKESVWRASLADGRRQGAPTLVHSDLWRVTPLGASRDALFYSVSVEEPELRLATVDVHGARVLTSPTAVRPPLPGRPVAPAWSADGSFMAYVMQPVAGARRADLVIHTVATGEDRVLRPDLDYAGQLVWEPGGRALIAAGARQGRQGLYRIELESASVQPVVVTQGREFWASHHALSHDGGTMYYTVGGPEGFSVMALDLADGTERVLWAGMGTGLVLSPDGAHLAIRHSEGPRTMVSVLSVAGGEPRTLHTVEQPVWIESGASLAWSVDGEHVVFAIRDRETALDIVRIPVAGGVPEAILSKPGDAFFYGLRLHPDGRRVVLLSGEQRNEVWVMENVMPGIRTAGLP